MVFRHHVAMNEKWRSFTDNSVSSSRLMKCSMMRAKTYLHESWSVPRQSTEGLSTHCCNILCSTVCPKIRAGKK